VLSGRWLGNGGPFFILEWNEECPGGAGVEGIALVWLLVLCRGGMGLVEGVVVGRGVVVDTRGGWGMKVCGAVADIICCCICRFCCFWRRVMNGGE